MKLIRAIVAATDFSVDAQHAAERAALVAEEHGASLLLLHVISDSALRSLQRMFQAGGEIEARLTEDATGMLKDVAVALGRKTGVTGREDLRVGQVLPKILEAAEAADLLVLGASGASSLRDLILGSTAERVLRTCRRPLLVVKGMPRAAYRHVLVPVDFSAYSASALNMARSIAPRARITLLHAIRVPFEGRLRMAGATEEAIDQYCEAEGHLGAKKIRDLIQESPQGADRLSFAIERGDPSRVIAAKAEALSADLIVVGKHGQSGVEELFLGSVTRHVLAGAKCDVLVVTREQDSV